MGVQYDRMIAAQRSTLMEPPWPLMVAHANGTKSLSTTNEKVMRGRTIGCENCQDCSVE